MCGTDACVCACDVSLDGPAHALNPRLFHCYNNMSLLFRLTASWCGYTGFFPLSVRHVVSGCELLCLRTLCFASGIQVVLECRNV